MGIQLKREDQVLVISGKSKGSKGKVIRVIHKKNSVVIEGVNRAKKHEKPNQKNEQGGIVDKEMPVHVSNVMLISPKTSKPVKTARKRNEKGKQKHIRIEKKNPENVLE